MPSMTKKMQADYRAINVLPLMDSRLSLKAKGLLAFMLVMDDGVGMSDIPTFFPDGKDAVRSAFNELSGYGYAVCRRCQDEKGLQGWEYELRDFPADLAIKPTADIPEVGKSSHIYIYKKKTKNKNTQEEKQSSDLFDPRRIAPFVYALKDKGITYNYGRCVKELKATLLGLNDDAKLLEGFKKYLQETELQYVSVPRFVTLHLGYVGKAKKPEESKPIDKHSD